MMGFVPAGESIQQAARLQDWAHFPRIWKNVLGKTWRKSGHITSRTTTTTTFRQERREKSDRETDLTQHFRSSVHSPCFRIWPTFSSDLVLVRKRTTQSQNFHRVQFGVN